MTKVIALSGGYRVGKTYFADQLASYLGCPHYAYADALKGLAIQYNPSMAPQIMAPTKTPETRQLLHDIAKKCKAKFGERVWINRVHLDIYATQPEYAIISDVRFANEINAVKSDFVDSTLVYIGDDTSTYDTQMFCDVADYFLPAKPVKNLAQLAYLTKIITNNYIF